MKVLHIISNADIGGSQVHLLDILKYNQKINDYGIVVICPKSGIYSKLFQQFSKTYCIDFSKSVIDLFRIIKTIIQQEQPNYIHTHLTKATLFGAIVGRQNQIPCLYNLHAEITDDVTRSPFKIFLYKYLYRIVLLLGGRYIAISKYHQQKMLERNIPAKKIVLIYNGVDEQRFNGQLSKKQNESLKICTIGRLHPQKGLHFLLDIASRLPQINFDIFGEGILKSSLQDRIDKEELTNVNLQGFIFDINMILIQYDAFLMTSRGEGFGLVIAEAMAFGLPVVSTNTGAIPELVVDGEGGFLFDFGAVDAAVQAITRLQNSPKLSAKFGQFNQNRFQEKFTLTQMMNALKAVYFK